MSKFGTNLKRARESLGIPLEKIAAETRISVRFLQAIENEDFQQLPGGIFNRGFIRTYAERVGVDSEEAVADYERLCLTAEPEPVLGPMSQEPRRRPRNLYPVSVGALVLLIVTFYFVTRFSNTNSVPETRPVVEATAPIPNVLPAPNPAPPPTPVLAPEPNVVEAAPEPVAPPAALALDLEAHEATWVKLAADGATAGGELLQPGTTRRYTAQTSMDLTVGNAGGLTIKLNGQEMRSLGTSGKVRTVRITPDNIASYFN